MFYQLLLLAVYNFLLVIKRLTGFGIFIAEVLPTIVLLCSLSNPLFLLFPFCLISHHAFFYFLGIIKLNM